MMLARILRMNPNDVRLGIFRIADKANPADEAARSLGASAAGILR